MHTDAPTVTACPTCTSTNAVGLSDGTLLCLDCRHEWNPADVPVSRPVPPPTRPVPVPSPAATTDRKAVARPPGTSVDTDTVAGPDDDDAGGPAVAVSLEELVGTDVVLEGGQPATIVGFPDDDHMEVIVGEGSDTERFEVVGFNDVERSITAPPPEVAVSDETAVALAQVNMAVAGLVIRAGLASIAGEYPDAQLLTPPTGWLPLDTEALPALEQGVAYAVAFLIHAYSLDREQVGAIADLLVTDAQQLTNQKGGTEDD